MLPPTAAESWPESDARSAASPPKKWTGLLHCASQCGRGVGRGRYGVEARHVKRTLVAEFVEFRPRLQHGPTVKSVPLMQRVYSFKKRVRVAVETQIVPDPEMVFYFDKLPYQYENPFHSWAHLFMSSNVRQHYNFARL